MRPRGWAERANENRSLTGAAGEDFASETGQEHVESELSPGFHMMTAALPSASANGYITDNPLFVQFGLPAR
jgi:hypothetical protein